METLILRLINLLAMEMETVLDKRRGVAFPGLSLSSTIELANGCMLIISAYHLKLKPNLQIMLHTFECARQS